jgi:ABC-type nitrate/sulfonate/bicarbonate transport system permease component
MKSIKKIIPFAVILLLWELLSRTGLLNAQLLPSPSVIFAAAVQLAASGEIFTDLLFSVKRVLAGFLAASVLGLTAGAVSGYSRRVSDAVMPLCEFLRPIPPIAWIPIAILWFGLGDNPAYFIVFVGSFFPIFINSYWGVRESRINHLNVARNFGAGRALTLTDVLLPGSLPRIMHGLRIGLGLGWTSVISAELVGAQSGLGYMIQLNRIMLSTENILVGMAAIGLAGLGMNWLMLLLERRLLAWSAETLQAEERDA